MWRAFGGAIDVEQIDAFDLVELNASLLIQGRTKPVVKLLSVAALDGDDRDIHYTRMCSASSTLAHPSVIQKPLTL